MDLNQAVAKHLEWKTTLRTAITRQANLDVKTVSADNCCELGKWLHGDAKKQFSNLNSYKNTLQKHAEFHTEAGRVATAINSKKYAEAETMLGAGTAYAKASTAVGIAIGSFKQEAGL
jgi:methyl-accepting chemotaxis protein